MPISFLSVSFLTVAAIGLLAWGVHLLLTLQTWESRRYARSRTGEAAPTTNQSVTLIVPCKGKELDGEKHLSALLDQDHPCFDVLFVVESQEDPAVQAIQAARARFPQVRSQLVVAGRCDDSGQKVHNLLVATERIGDPSAILAFADADACPDRKWLRHLVGRLRQPRVGAVTGYRWFIPKHNRLPNLVLYSMNSALAGLLGPGKLGVVWGGAWAIRRDVFDEIDLRTAWRGTLSDDLVANRAIREAGLEVRFEPNCMVTTPIDFNWAQAAEFGLRQCRIARLYLTEWWGAALVTAVVCQIALWAQLMLALSPQASPAVRATLAISVTGMVGLLMLRAKWRQDMVELYTQNHEPLKVARRFDRVASPLVSLVSAGLLACSIFGKRIRWRGISYLVSPSGRSQLIGRRCNLDSSPVLLQFPPEADAAKTRHAA